MASNNSGSRVPSIELDVIVEEGPQTRKVSHREQAMLWSLHSPSVDSDKENQLETEAEDGRLGEDEKKAMDEAIDRSIDDLVGKFDEVFLDGNADPSSGSSSEDDELEDLVNSREDSMKLSLCFMTLASLGDFSFEARKCGRKR